MITREDLQRLGFVAHSEDLVETWSSSPNIQGGWIVVRFEDLFLKTVVQWEWHCWGAVVPIPVVPTTVEALVGLLTGLGIEVKP